MPPGFPGLKGSLSVLHPIFPVMQNVWLSFPMLTLEMGARCLGSPFTVSLLTHDPVRPANQIPLLEKLKPRIDEQWEVKLEGVFLQLSRHRGAGAATTGKMVGQTPGLGRTMGQERTEQRRGREEGKKGEGGKESHRAGARARKTGCLSPSSFRQYIPLLLPFL